MIQQELGAGDAAGAGAAEYELGVFEFFPVNSTALIKAANTAIEVPC